MWRSSVPTPCRRTSNPLAGNYTAPPGKIRFWIFEIGKFFQATRLTFCITLVVCSAVGREARINAQIADSCRASKSTNSSWLDSLFLDEDIVPFTLLLSLRARSVKKREKDSCLMRLRVPTVPSVARVRRSKRSAKRCHRSLQKFLAPFQGANVILCKYRLFGKSGAG